MTPTQRRLEALEARTRANHAGAVQAEHGRAFGALFAVLRAAFPVRLDEQILSLDERIAAGAMTPTDADLLATLPADDLATCKLTGAEVIGTLARVLRSVNE